MPGGELGNHLTDYIIEVQARTHVRQQHGVFVFDGLPVASVHVFNVVAVAEGAPDLVEDLRPLLTVVNYGNHIAHWDLLPLHLSVQLGNGVAVAVAYQGLLVSKAVRHRAGDALLVFAACEVVDAGGAKVAVPYLLAVGVEPAAAERQLDYAGADALRVDLHLYGLLGLIGLGTVGAGLAGGEIGLAAGNLCTGLGLRVGKGYAIRASRRHTRESHSGAWPVGTAAEGRAVLREQRRGRVGGKHRHISGAHIAEGEVPLDATVLRVDIPV